MNSPPPPPQGWPPGYGSGGHDPAYASDPAYGYGPTPQPQQFGYGPNPYAQQYGYGPPTPYGQPPYPTPPPRRSRAWPWVLAVAVVVLVGAAATTTVVLVNREPDITALTSAMTLPKADFPKLPDGEFSVEPVDRNPEYQAVDVTPAECEYLVGYPKARETVSARVSSDSSIVAVYLQIDDVRPDLKAALNDCEGQTLEAASSTYEVHALNLGGLPSWAIAETLKYDNDGSTGENSVIGGYHRGVYVEAWSSADDTDFDDRDLVDLFNAQVDRLAER